MTVILHPLVHFDQEFKHIPIGFLLVDVLEKLGQLGFTVAYL